MKRYFKVLDNKETRNCYDEYIGNTYEMVKEYVYVGMVDLKVSEDKIETFHIGIEVTEVK